MKAKKKAEQEKRPPRQVWLVFSTHDASKGYAHPTKKEAEEDILDGERVVGPYVLAERVRER